VEFVKTELQGNAERMTAKPMLIEAPEMLLEAARQNPDAVAFGYMSGKWVAAA
jgi:hypothetical protein